MPLHDLAVEDFVVGVCVVGKGTADPSLYTAPVPPELGYALTLILEIAVPVVVVIVYDVDVVNTFETLPLISNKTL